VTSFAALQIPLNALGLILCGVGIGLIAASGISKISKTESEGALMQERQRNNVH
jgi:F0F1-type ATP synthase membrane subunit c/vacuolar-type H+-ATPase subunit K